MNLRSRFIFLSSAVGVLPLLAGTAWTQAEDAADSGEALHRETEDLFREIERRLGRIDEGLYGAGDRLSTTQSTADCLRSARSEGEFVVSAMDRLLEIQAHHSGPGG